MAIIDIDKMYSEIANTMKNNFSGTPSMKYELAKALFLNSVAKVIEENKEALLKEVK